MCNCPLRPQRRHEDTLLITLQRHYLLVDFHVRRALVDACVHACVDHAAMLVLGIAQHGEHGMELWHEHKHLFFVRTSPG